MIKSKFKNKFFKKKQFKTYLYLNFNSSKKVSNLKIKIET